MPLDSRQHSAAEEFFLRTASSLYPKDLSAFVSNHRQEEDFSCSEDSACTTHSLAQAGPESAAREAAAGLAPALGDARSLGPESTSRVSSDGSPSSSSPGSHSKASPASSSEESPSSKSPSSASSGDSSGDSSNDSSSRTCPCTLCAPRAPSHTASLFSFSGLVPQCAVEARDAECNAKRKSKQDSQDNTSISNADISLINGMDAARGEHGRGSVAGASVAHANLAVAVAVADADGNAALGGEGEEFAIEAYKQLLCVQLGVTLVWGVAQWLGA